MFVCVCVCVCESEYVCVYVCTHLSITNVLFKHNAVFPMCYTSILGSFYSKLEVYW